MNTPTVGTTSSRRSSLSGKIAALAGVLLLAQPLLAADIPDRQLAIARGPSGYYKIASTNDPIFSGENREWFLDFGKNLQEGKTSGTVAVSMRQNPNVRVRILVWQLYPASNTLVLGHQTAEGSKQAVVLASWKVNATPSGLLLRRGDYQMVIHRADAAD